MVKDKQFYKVFFSMAIVLMLQNVVTLSVNLADNIMLGGYSEISLSGVAACNQIQFVFHMMIGAFGEGITILGSQYFGKKDMGSVKKIISIAMRLGLCVALALTLAVTFFPHAMLTAFTTEESIIAEGCRYLTIIRFTYILFAVTQLLVAALRSVGIVKISLYLSFQSLIINCCINYCLIYGRFGFLEMGVMGAAIGTLCARTAELLVILYFAFRREKNLQLTFRDFLPIDRTLFMDYVKVTLPVFVISSLWGLNNAVQNMILGHMTARAIAANSVASTLFMLVKSLAVGASAATVYLIGKTIGEGNEAKLRSYATTLQSLFVCIGILSGIILFFLRIPILSLYNLEPATHEMANRFLLILAVVVTFMAYQMPTNSGIIKGGGDTRYVMIMDLISIWGIVIPISLIMAFWVGAGAETVLWCLNADQIFKCVPAFIKCNFGHWAKKLTR